MELIYENDYGATYHITNSPNPVCELQMVIDGVGLFMSRSDLDELASVIQKSKEPCHCPECQGAACKKIWCSNPRIDICLKINKPTIKKMLDLIKGTQFMLNIDTTLEQYRLK